MQLRDGQRVVGLQRHLRRGCSTQILALQDLSGDVAHDCDATQRVALRSAEAEAADRTMSVGSVLVGVRV